MACVSQWQIVLKCHPSNSFNNNCKGQSDLGIIGFKKDLAYYYKIILVCYSYEMEYLITMLLPPKEIGIA